MQFTILHGPPVSLAAIKANMFDHYPTDIQVSDLRISMKSAHSMYIDSIESFIKVPFM